MKTSNNNELKPVLSSLYSSSAINFTEGSKKLKTEFPEYVSGLFPFGIWIKNYQLGWIAEDIVAGLTVGAMIVPQALAYSKLTGLSSEYALYSSLVGGIVYSFFGTCREISLGPTAIVCIILGQSIQEVKSQTSFTGSEIASVFCIICAVISLTLGVLRLGFLLELVSQPVILGFTTGVAFKTIISQIPGLLGIPNVNINQPSHLMIASICNNISATSWINSVFGLASLLFLLSLKFITNRFNKYFVIQYISIGSIGIVVIIFTIFAYLLNFSYPNIKVNLVGNIPSGIKFTLPSTDPALWLKAFPLSIPLTLILLMEVLVISKTFSKIGGYSANTSQEMVALGMANLIGAFFSAFPITGSLSRAGVLSKTSVRSPLAGIFASIVAILAVAVLTPAFKYIPLPTLAAVIIVAFSKLIMKWSELINLLQNDKFDFFLCILCVILTFFLGGEVGIYISVGLSFFIMVVRIAHPKLSILFKVIGEDDHFEDRNIAYFESENPEPGVIIFRPKESLLFLNIEYFKDAMMRVILEETAGLATPLAAIDKPWSDDLLSKGEQLRIRRSRKTGLFKINYSDLVPLKAVIMDLTSVNLIDGPGLQGLRDFKEQCEVHSGQETLTTSISSNSKLDNVASADIKKFEMLFVTTSPVLIRKLKNISLISSNQNDIYINCYHSVGTALVEFSKL
jgi:sodium-independent sulfate anion transporter 11